MTVLFLADIHPKSHNLKWILHLTKKYHLKSYVVCTTHQMTKASQAHLDFLSNHHVSVLPPVHDYSTVALFQTLRDGSRIKRILREYDIEIIHVMYAEPNALWGLWKRYFKKPMLLTTRGTDILYTIPAFFGRKDLLSRIIQWEYRKSLGSFSAITSTSKSQIESVRNIATPSAIHLVRTGIDDTSIATARLDMKQQLNITKEIILMPRSMLPIYNHEFTLEAIALLNEQYLNKYTFVFVNSDTSDQQYFQKIQSKAATIEADIRFYSAFKPVEIYSLFKQSSLVVMNPISDGSAVSAMEAMASKSPVILPPLAYDEDIFGGYVFQLKEWKSDELMNLIVSILNMSPDKKEKWLQDAQNHILSDFTTSSQMAKVYSIYSNLIENKRHVND